MEISWQYLAGFLDGEGSIGTTRTGKYRNVVGRVTIANTDQRLLELLKTQFGGTISRRAQGSQPGWKPFASITWTNRGAQRLLEQVLPYLIAKRPQAELCLQLIRMRDVPKNERCEISLKPSTSRSGRSPVVGRIRPEVFAIEVRIAEQLKALNRKGVPVV
jgi:hypothetical protein